MPWQELLVGLLIAAAALYLGRQTWRTWSGRGSGCATGCGKGCADPAEKDAQPTFIPEREVTLRRR